MSIQQAQAIGLSPLPNFGASDFVNSDFDALESHMRRCERSRDRMASVRLALEMFHSVASARIVTTGAVFATCALVLLAIA
ncbi:hypothetical protein [Caenimonas aquaedulcis]|uniref:Uncharacterized protein n=1 Tax=Caenimonas aquaedulcis TaxID=2793270 RepID=A0A931H4S4_9BURK|nr:hypothetical protein [Caenimonas aquaedulcis]MBG9388630.1 hypothetical protein [Caenimonas aquaedulcis]